MTNSTITSRPFKRIHFLANAVMFENNGASFRPDGSSSRGREGIVTVGFSFYGFDWPILLI